MTDAGRRERPATDATPRRTGAETPDAAGFAREVDGGYDWFGSPLAPDPDRASSAGPYGVEIERRRSEARD